MSIYIKELDIWHQSKGHGPFMSDDIRLLFPKKPRALTTPSPSILSSPSSNNYALSMTKPYDGTTMPGLGSLFSMMNISLNMNQYASNIISAWNKQAQGDVIVGKSSGSGVMDNWVLTQPVTLPSKKRKLSRKKNVAPNIVNINDKILWICRYGY